MARNNEQNRDSRHHYDWMQFASADLLAAQTLMQDQRCYALAAFHCQQCIEKILKAYILYQGNRLVDGHNLVWLIRQAARYNENFRQWMDECVYINHYYIESRYPSDFELDINKDRMQAVFNKAKSLFNDISIEIYQQDVV